MLHVISTRCVARDLRTIAPGLLERACWSKKSGIAPLNAIIIIYQMDLCPASGMVRLSMFISPTDCMAALCKCVAATMCE